MKRQTLAIGAAIASTVIPFASHAQQTNPTPVPPVSATAPAVKPVTSTPATKKAAAAEKSPAAAPVAKPKSAAAPAVPAESAPASSAPSAAAAAAAASTAFAVPAAREGALTVPNLTEARRELATIPGGAAVVGREEYAATTARTAKDALDFVPGVLVQPKWGEDSRISIRGSGLSRNFHTRGVWMYMDGIPITTADGGGDMQEISPTAYRYIEVYRGANALRYGANALGGAINFVTPTGRDASVFEARTDFGSFGLARFATSSGGAYGAADYFLTVDRLNFDGFRDHSSGESTRFSGNLGYRITPDIETRFYANANDIDQRIPGAVTRAIALASPKTAAAANLANDYQRNIDSWRVANKTAVRLSDTTTLEASAFYYDRHLYHPIFQVVDYFYNDYGGTLRLVDARKIGGLANRLTVGANLHDGAIDARRYVNVKAQRGALTFNAEQISHNRSLYFENALYMVPRLALIGGGQYLDASREQRDRFLPDGNQTGQASYQSFSPRAGVLYDLSPQAQLFANWNEANEVPTFSEISITPALTTSLKPQVSRTVEIGTRGRTDGLVWDLALYRAEITNEFQCLNTGTPGSCTQVNIDKSIHQGVEAGLSARIIDGLAVNRQGARDALWLNLAYTYSDFRFDNDRNFGDNKLPGAPEHYLRAEVLYRHPSGIYLGPNIEAVPEAFYVDNRNQVKTESYLLWGAKIGFDGEKWAGTLEGRNLGDVKYISSASIATSANAASALFEPGDGRAVYGSLRYKW
jgi:iron complex outermembrane receptor protein